MSTNRIERRIAAFASAPHIARLQTRFDRAATQLSAIAGISFSESETKISALAYLATTSPVHSGMDFVDRGLLNAARGVPIDDLVRETGLDFIHPLGTRRKMEN